MNDVLRLQDVGVNSVASLLSRYGLQLDIVPDAQPIPGSYWHEDEAGIIGLSVFVRQDTPLHSLLHESCHTICMDETRRAVLHTDACGEYSEEDAVCYLQILLADCVAGFGRERAWQDMDTWGYTFRLGSAKRWFQEDAEDARAWLIQHSLLTPTDDIMFQLRQT
ncbi:MAG: hypothetical protein RL122_1293 [Pseudomonadota bacterium]|jgi:hypothetical protein|uniref:Uncharacterized protein n=1 Tax=Thiothrix fructosivorans TaxID=111770 RepID=A0A8B0SI07_9GAMM|nr:hypothetical protein [Thiothrix fructosivorans]MBO0611800.1 hypothetical protein [Thiothrix fructosivorans]QTX10545.1 hypothetical protein J1836_018560 [Thiothrix fructosivorans]